MKTKVNKFRTAIYMRLSKDDEGAGESASITTQRKMLSAYCAEHGYKIAKEYVDAAVIIGLKTLRL